jgi:hypothetical protein
VAAPRPWVKLWRDERGSFAQLPLYTRALAAELLKLADADGRIGLGNKPPAEAICWAMGATRSDRRLVARDVALLLADGYLEHDEEGCALVISGWSKWQTDGLDPTTKRSRRSNEPTTTEQRTDHEAVTTVSRPSNDRVTTEQRPSNETGPKYLKTGLSKTQEGEGEGEVDKRERESVRAPDPISIVKRVYQARYERRWNDAFFGFDSAHRQLQAIAAWASRQPEGTEAAMHRLIDGADRQERLTTGGNRWPLRWLAEDPASHAAYVGGRQQTTRAASPLSAWADEPEVA